MPPRKGPGYMSVRARPTSPHLQIYRWTVTMTMSILHRMTGIANYAGMALLAIWLGSAGSAEPEAFGITLMRRMEERRLPFRRFGICSTGSSSRTASLSIRTNGYFPRMIAELSFIAILS